MGKTKGGYYAVANGLAVGIYRTWDECKAQVNGFPNARYQKFPTEQQATDFIKKYRVSIGGGISKNKSTGVKPAVPLNLPTTSTLTAAPNAVLTPFLPALTPVAPAWKKSIKHPLHQPRLPGNVQLARGLSISVAEFRKKLRVTEDRVVNMSNMSSDSSSSNAGVSLNGFTVDDDGFVVVYTDGACKANGKYGAKAGIGIWFGANHALNVSEPVKGRQTNNTAEIQATEVALSQAKKAGIHKLCVKTDSQFVINCITKWTTKWIKNGWKLSDGQPVKNKEDLEKLIAEMKGMEVKWSYVAGHKGHHGNEEADRLAVLGSKKR